MRRRKNKHRFLRMQSMLSVLLALCLLLTAAPLAAFAAKYGPPLENPVGDELSWRFLGDVDGDGYVTAADARYTLRAAVGLEYYASGSREFDTADYNRDGRLTAEDARMVLRTAVQLEELYVILSTGELKPYSEITDPGEEEPTEITFSVEVFNGEGYEEIPLAVVYTKMHGVVVDGPLMFTTVEEYARSRELPVISYSQGYDVQVSYTKDYKPAESLTVYRDTGDALEKVENAEISSLDTGTYLMDYTYIQSRGDDASVCSKALFWLKVIHIEPIPTPILSDSLAVTVFDGVASRSLKLDILYLHSAAVMADGELMFVPFDQYVRSHEFPTVDYTDGYNVSYTVAQGETVKEGLSVYRDTGDAFEQLENTDPASLAPGTYLMRYSYSVKAGDSYSAMYYGIFWLNVK